MVGIVDLICKIQNVKQIMNDLISLIKIVVVSMNMHGLSKSNKLYDPILPPNAKIPSLRNSHDLLNFQR